MTASVHKKARTEVVRPEHGREHSPGEDGRVWTQAWIGGAQSRWEEGIALGQQRVEMAPVAVLTQDVAPHRFILVRFEELKRAAWATFEDRAFHSSGDWIDQLGASRFEGNDDARDQTGGPGL